jgi:hypothetical protein
MRRRSTDREIRKSRDREYANILVHQEKNMLLIEPETAPPNPNTIVKKGLSLSIIRSHSVDTGFQSGFAKKERTNIAVSNSRPKLTHIDKNLVVEGNDIMAVPSKPS